MERDDSVAGKTYSFPETEGGAVEINDEITVRVWHKGGKVYLNIAQKPRYPVNIISQTDIDKAIGETQNID